MNQTSPLENLAGPGKTSLLQKSRNGRFSNVVG